MPADKRKLVRTIVFEAFDLYEYDRKARDAFLRSRCGDNAELLSLAMNEAEAEEHVRKARFMERPAAFALSGVIPEGTEIGDYRFGTLIGEGAMGSVYRARQISLDRDVAIKTLRSPLAPQARSRFLSEARALSRIASSRVVHVYGYGDYHGHPYIAMEYVEGTNLGQLIAEERIGTFEARLTIALQIAEGMEHIHLANIAHRDVKPSNVLIDASGNIKLIDFGIAWREDSRVTEIGQALGTPAYMPPEQILRQLGGTATDVEQYRRVDIYSFGILMYELFTGTLPFDAETRGEVERQIVHAPVRLEPLRARHVPEGIVELIRLSTAKMPAARPRSFTEVANVLRIYVVERAPESVEPPVRAVGLGVRWQLVAATITVTAVALALQLRSAGTAHPQVPRPFLSVPLSSGASPAVDRPSAQPTVEIIRVSPQAPSPRGSRTESAVQPPIPRKTTVNAGLQPPAIAIESNRYAQAAEENAARVAPPPLPAPPIPEFPLRTAETPEDRDWARSHDSGDVAALRAFRTAYPQSKYSHEARKILAALEYDTVKNSDDPKALQRFAQEHPDHVFAPVAESMAQQLEARAVAAVEIRDALARYASAIQRMSLDDVARWRELNKQQRQSFANMFKGARRIEVALVPKSLPDFLEPVLRDPGASSNIPSRATIRADQNMLVDSGRGDIQSVRRELTIHLRKAAKGWIIAGL